MTQQMSKIISRAITKENEVIGDLKSQFSKNSLRSQRLVGISPAIANGNISLAYYRGLAEGQKEIEYWKSKFLKLKAKRVE